MDAGWSLPKYLSGQTSTSVLCRSTEWRLTFSPSIENGFHVSQLVPLRCRYLLFVDDKLEPPYFGPYGDDLHPVDPSSFPCYSG